MKTWQEAFLGELGVEGWKIKKKKKNLFRNSAKPFLRRNYKKWNDPADTKRAKARPPQSLKADHPPGTFSPQGPPATGSFSYQTINPSSAGLFQTDINALIPCVYWHLAQLPHPAEQTLRAGALRAGLWVPWEMHPSFFSGVFVLSMEGRKSILKQEAVFTSWMHLDEWDFHYKCVWPFVNRPTPSKACSDIY